MAINIFYEVEHFIKEECARVCLCLRQYSGNNSREIFPIILRVETKIIIVQKQKAFHECGLF